MDLAVQLKYRSTLVIQLILRKEKWRKTEIRE